MMNHNPKIINEVSVRSFSEVFTTSKSFAFPGCSLIRIVSSTSPGSVSLVHGFTHDKSVPYLFSTPQARSNSELKFLSSC